MSDYDPWENIPGRHRFASRLEDNLEPLDWRDHICVMAIVGGTVAFWVAVVMLIAKGMGYWQ